MSEDYQPFERFFTEMIKEMRRHEPKKGFGWYDYKDFDWWDSALFKALNDYIMSKDSTQLIDIANFCAMIWWNRNSAMLQNSTHSLQKEK